MQLKTKSVMNDTQQPAAKLRKKIYRALETYSNVHRGSGHNSMVTTHLFEEARKQVLDFAGMNNSNYVVIFLHTRSC